MNYSDKDVPPVLFRVTPWGPTSPWALNTITGIILIISYKTLFQELYRLAGGIILFFKAQGEYLSVLTPGN